MKKICSDCPYYLDDAEECALIKDFSRKSQDLLLLQRCNLSQIVDRVVKVMVYQKFPSLLKYHAVEDLSQIIFEKRYPFPSSLFTNAPKRDLHTLVRILYVPVRYELLDTLNKHEPYKYKSCGGCDDWTIVKPHRCTHTGGPH